MLSDLEEELKKMKDANLALTLKYNRMKSHTLNEAIQNYMVAIPHNNIQIMNPEAVLSPTAYTPSQINSAYDISRIATNGLKGAGIKVGVIIAYHYANLQSDFNKFCTLYNLPNATLNITNLAGNARNSGWALEECLDVQMIHTTAPGASIYVYEAKSASITDLNKALQTAIKSGMDIISMSWGSSEYSSQSNSIFTGANTCFLASAGDTSYQVCYPSSSSNVLALGGTNLQLNNGIRSNETVWNSSGGGVSLYVQKPTYQANFNSSYNTRCVPDISMVADPNTGVYVICSAYSSSPISVGGTSASCPLFAGFLAIVNQLRIANNKSKLTTVTGYSNNLQNMLYNSVYPNTKAAIYDIVTGNDSIFQASTGYDIISGIGSFNGEALCAALVAL